MNNSRNSPKENVNIGDQRKRFDQKKRRWFTDFSANIGETRRHHN